MIETAWFVAVVVLLIWMALCTVRIILGPTAPDRVVALDTVNTLTVAAMILLGVAYQEIIFIDVAIVYTLLSFVSTLFIAKYLAGEL